MIKSDINISYESTIKNYNDLNNLFKDVISALYGKKSTMHLKEVYSKDIINIKDENNLTVMNQTL